MAREPAGKLACAANVLVLRQNIIKVDVHLSGGVANEEALHVGLRRGVGILGGGLEDRQGQLGEIVACVRLTGEIQVVRGELREALEEAHENIVVVRSSLVVVKRRGRVGVGESNTSRRLNVEHVGNAVPGEGVADEVAVAVGAEGAVFGEETSKGRASGTAVEPENKRIIRR